METTQDQSLEALETRARLEVKVRRTLLRHQFIMIGNALLTAFLFAVLVLLIWTAMLAFGGTSAGMMAVAAPVMGISVEQMMWLGAVLLVTFKIAAILLLLCPGLGFRICGSAMRP